MREGGGIRCGRHARVRTRLGATPLGRKVGVYGRRCLRATLRATLPVAAAAATKPSVAEPTAAVAVASASRAGATPSQPESAARPRPSRM
jgi:hypothetical protein